MTLNYTFKPVFPVFFLLLFSGIAQGQITLSISKENLKCFGDSSGQATVNINGGTPPYSIAWNTGAGTQTIQHLAAGMYSVTVHDALNNLASIGTTIQQPTVLNAVAFGQSQICDQAPDGKATAVPSGGTPPYAYHWSNGMSNAEISNLSEGTYTVTVSDNKGCTDKDSVQISNWHEGLWIMINTNPALCQYPTGNAHASPMTGTPPYQYLWNTGATTDNLQNLSPGTYRVSITDINGCATSVNVDVAQRTLELSSASSLATCAYNDGTATVFSPEGNAPFQFSWSNGDSSIIINNLSPGLYTATVTDANGCTGTKSVPVPSAGPTPIGYGLTGSKCLNTIATFKAGPTPPLYPEIKWTLDNPADLILSGQSTDSIRVKWNSVGVKYVTAQYGHNGIFCMGEGYTFQVTICAGTEDAGLSGIQVFPNPFSEVLSIQLPDGFKAGRTEVALFNIAGTKLLQQSIDVAAPAIATTGLPTGFYFLKIKSSEGEKTWKISKN